MPIEFIPTRADQAQRPVIDNLITRLTNEAEELGIEDGVLYYGWPKFQDYEAVGHPVDLALLSKKTGLILIRVVEAQNLKRLEEADESIAQAAASAVAQMIKSPLLRSKRRSIKFDVVPVLYNPGYHGLNIGNAEIKGAEDLVVSLINESEDQGLSADDISESRSILEGAKALMRSTRRIVDDPVENPVAAALSSLEEEIARFDAQQRHVALTSMRCPQRIRGLAGSGKTVILAMKAALAHIEDPTSQILVTYYTRSLRDYLVRLITRFYRHFAEGEPDWKRVHVYHGWGRTDLKGVYRAMSLSLLKFVGQASLVDDAMLPS